MIRQIKYVGVFVGAIVLASVANAQTYQMVLTGVGDGVTADGVYVSPYQGTIVQGGIIPTGSSTINGGTTVYAGYVICDDFTTDSSLNSPWTATATNAANLNGTEKFTSGTMFQGTSYSAQQRYDAVAYLANKLLAVGDNPTAQINYSFAIWDIMDGQMTDPSGGATSLIQQAYAAIASPSNVYTNVDVFTAMPQSASQEFLVVGGPSISTPEPVAAGILGANLLTILGLLLLLRRRRRAEAA